MRCVFRSISLCFNTQPPEGGCAHRRMCRKTEWLFQHTAARRRLRRSKRHSRPCSLFQHTAARRRLQRIGAVVVVGVRFQHTAARRRLPEIALFVKDNRLFQHTAARRRLPKERLGGVCVENVSTHSRPKAAACFRGHANFGKSCFNTQPPEGGCMFPRSCEFWQELFQHTAARRRLLAYPSRYQYGARVSTHSRPKAAASSKAMAILRQMVSTHSRPKAAAQVNGA